MSHPRKVSARALLAAGALAWGVYACGDRSPPTGVDVEEPQIAADELPGGCPSEATESVVAGDSILFLNFTPTGACSAINQDADGVMFSDSTVTENWWVMRPEGENLPSPPFSARAAGGTPGQFYIGFNPPVSSVSFSYATNVPIHFEIYNGLFFAISVDSVPLNNPTNPPTIWDQITLSAPPGAAHGQRIHAMWIKRTDSNGGAGVWLDDFETIREGPPPSVSCTPVTRGSTTTCTVAAAGSATVTEWRFSGADSNGTPVVIIDSTNATTTWQGPAVLSGSVQATLSTAEVASGPLAVINRPWGWTFGEYEPFIEDLPSSPCVSFDPLDMDTNAEFAINTTLEVCEPDTMFLPSPQGGSFLDGFEFAPVPAGGPNEGLHYVTSTAYRSHRTSLLNPVLRDSTLYRVLLTHNPNKSACVNQTEIPNAASWREFNVQCQDLDMDGGFIPGVVAHEGMGNGDTSVPEPNGHQARFLKRAAEPSGDPKSVVEDVVVENLIDFLDGVRDRVLDVQQDLLDFTRQEPMNPPNWCGEIWVHRSGNNRYTKFNLPTGGQNPLPCP